MKANFPIKKNKKIKKSDTSDELTEKEFENFISKAGAAGTFRPAGATFFRRWLGLGFDI